VTLIYIEEQNLGKQWRSWEQIDDLNQVPCKERQGAREVIVDLAECFFSKLDSR